MIVISKLFLAGDLFQPDFAAIRRKKFVAQYFWFKVKLKQKKFQPRTQGLSSYRLGRARRDPGWVWSRAPQNLGDYN